MSIATQSRHAEILAIIAAYQDEYDRFLAYVEPVFNRMLMAKPPGLTSRPQCSLRLPLLGEGDATLVVRPRWGKRCGILPGITVEVVCRSIWMGKTVARVNQGVVIKEGECKWTRWSNKELLDRMLRGMEEFMVEPIAVFQRSKEHCCCCGRKLSDEVSRSRGIGPECIKIWS